MDAVIPFAYWTGSNDTTMLSDFLTEWRRAYPQFRLVGDAELRPLLGKIGPEDAALYRRLRLPAAKSDVARLLMLYYHGGLYVDCHTALTNDTQLRADLALLKQHELVVWQRSFAAFPRPREEQRPVNGILAARKGSPILEHIIASAFKGLREQAKRESRGDTGEYSVWHLTGAGLIRDVLCESDSRFLRIRPEFGNRIGTSYEDDGAVTFWQHGRYRANGAQHWSEREKHEPLFAPRAGSRASRNQSPKAHFDLQGRHVRYSHTEAKKGRKPGVNTAQSIADGRIPTSPATPARALGELDSAGCRVLRDTSATYRDGAEAQVLELIRHARDLRSDSTELKASAVGWAQRYHLDPARANIVRCLDLPPEARVLEVGAGCGAISRYLGETCAIVDSLEPVAIRAAGARARTRDQPGVEVLVGELDDVPAVPTYDVVVVVGVLEYVGNGSDDRHPYREFLAKIAARLVDGGSLILAIENRLGVKYLAGAPEDHTDRVFDSVEGYPHGGNARTFDRRELEGLVEEAGLTPMTLTAFPDYKMTRAVFGQFPQACRSLLYRIPKFPSPDWRSPRPRLLDERLLWRELVNAGLDSDFGNSFLVLASRGGTPSLWPDGRAGAFYTTNRRPTLNTATMIETVGETVQLRRTTLRPGAGEVTSGFRIVESTRDFETGSDLTSVLATGGVDAWRELIPDWLRLVDKALAEDPETAVDVVPHNLVVDTDTGAVHVIDVELSCPGVNREQLIRRGVFWLAERCTPLAPVQRWAPARTVGDVMRLLGEPVGLPKDGSWIDQAVAEELGLLAHVLSGPDVVDTQSPDAIDRQEKWLRGLESWLRGRVSQPLADLPLGVRLPERAAADRKATSAAQAKRAAADKELAKVRRRLAASEDRRKRLEKTLAVRATRRGRRAAAQLLPAGTRRRELVNRVRGR